MSIEEVYKKIEERKNEALSTLIELLKIPSIAAKGTGAEEAVEYLQNQFEKAGFSCFVAKTPGNPVLCAEFNVGAEKTLAFYDHYDVQPEDPVGLWNTPPFEPTVKNGQLFARGVADNKGETICRLEAIKSYLEVFDKLPVNIKFIVEGEEEIGSPNLKHFVKEHSDFIKNSDGIIWEFGGRDNAGKPEVYLGVKGILYLHLETKTIGRDVHSGTTQMVDNAAYELVWALGALKDRQDKILVPGFYDDILPPTEELLKEIEDFPLNEQEFLESFQIEDFRLGLHGMELKKKYFLEPTCNICGIWSGYQGPGSKTVTPKEAHAKVDFRLVPKQNPADLVEKIRKYWDTQQFSHIKITSWDGYPASKTPRDHPFAQRVIATMKQVYGTEPVVWPLSGGSGPMYLFDPLPCVSIGTGHPNSNAHAPNENIYLSDWYKGMKTIATLIHNF
ncbi:MAG: M20/M25/M40 family metallo-hydrolase [Candidatus Heimdallarchaeaceae archaeon]